MLIELKEDAPTTATLSGGTIADGISTTATAVTSGAGGDVPADTEPTFAPSVDVPCATVDPPLFNEAVVAQDGVIATTPPPPPL